jgi:hypothetical protein
MLPVSRPAGASKTAGIPARLFFGMPRAMVLLGPHFAVRGQS